MAPLIFSDVVLFLVGRGGPWAKWLSAPLLSLLWREGGADLVWEKAPFDVLERVAPGWVAARLLAGAADLRLVWDLVSEGWSGTAAQLELVVGG